MPLGGLEKSLFTGQVADFLPLCRTRAGIHIPSLHTQKRTGGLASHLGCLRVRGSILGMTMACSDCENYNR